MGFYKEQLTQEDREFLEIDFFKALQLKAYYSPYSKRVLEIIDKINWGDNPNTLKYLYLSLINHTTEDIEFRNMLVKRLTDLVGADKVNDYYKEMMKKIENYSDGIMFVYD